MMDWHWRHRRRFNGGKSETDSEANMHRNCTIIPVLVLLLVSIGCPPKTPRDGIRIECDGTAAGLHWWARPINCAADDATCYSKKDRFGLCIDPNAKFAETGFDQEDWVNDTESIDFIRGECIIECGTQNSPYAVYADLYPNCSHAKDVWTIRNEDGIVTPDPGHAIKDPGHLDCVLSANSNLHPNPIPPELTVIAPGTTPRWPSTLEYIELICDNFLDCSEEFVAPILGYLFYEDVNGDWGNDLGRADYLAITSADTASTLTLSIQNPNSGISSGTNEVEGRLEYSAPNCGEMECPFYVANMTLANPADDWNLWSEMQAEHVHVIDVRARLRRPVLGIRNTVTNEIYIGEGMMEVHIEATAAVGAGDLETASFFVVNGTDLFGELRDGGAVSFSSLVATDGGMLAMEANLDYDVLTDGPPVADIGLPATVAAPTGSGLSISSITDDSSDPDDDIETKLWIVDGQQRAYDYVIPIGSHTLTLEVEDERGAFDIDEQVVDIIYP
jgi:hypothetical protein